MHGQALADALEKRRGERPSPGTLYPALKGLRAQGFIQEEREGKVIYYTLTPEGKKALAQAQQQFCKTFKDIL